MKSRFISVGILFALMLPAIWVAILFAFGIQAHRQLVHFQMRKNKLALTSLILSHEEFNALEWEHEKEFKLEGQMYDVEAIYKSPSKIVILVYKDLAENELIKIFRKGIKSTLGKGENSKEQSQLVGLWLKSLYLPPEPELISNSWLESDETRKFYYANGNAQSYTGNCFHPPAAYFFA